MLKKSNFFAFRSFLRYSSSSVNAQFLSDAFDLSYNEAKKYIDSNNLSHKETDILQESVSFCKKIGYSDTDILENPSLLRQHPVEVHNHYLVFEETGLKKIYPKVLAKARSYIRQKITHFKELELLDKDANVAKNFISYLDQKPFSDEFVANLSDQLKWTEIHMIVMKAYLKMRLKANDEDMIKLFRIHKMIKHKSFRQVRENIEMAEKLNFHNVRILRCGYLLHNYPDYPKKVIEDLDNLAGIDVRKAMRAFPKLTMVPPKNWIKIYGILKEFGVPDETIKNTPEIFQMAPETVRYRLEEVNRIPELKVMFNNPKVLSLVVHHNKATSRLSFLQQLQLKCAGIFLLSSAEPASLDNYVKNGKDRNNSRDLVLFLKNLLGDEERDIKKRIKRHPFYLEVPLLEMEKSFLFLRNMKYDRYSISKAVTILLYPQNKLEKAYKDMFALKTIKARTLNKVKQLNLMLYLIEKEHHFTGNGIWNSEHNPAHSDAMESHLY